MKKVIFFVILLCLVASAESEGQKKGGRYLVSGYVTDTDLKPVAGAMIVVDRQQTGVFTNRKGFYKVSIDPGSVMIGAWSKDKGSAESAIEGRTEVDIVLYGTFAIEGFDPSKVSDDDMINVGYGKVRKRDLTTSPGQIDGRQSKFQSYSNIYEMIKGEVPGVQVYGNQIVVRGISTINSGTEPLFVVDGTIVSSIDGISPRDVRSITVLKGSDAAIYGTRGANGVILIDLKGASNR